MPYSGPDDPDLPDNVQDLPQGEREQWVEVFNSAEARCQEEGLSEVADDPDQFENCEGFAFANANGVVLAGRSVLMQAKDAWQMLRAAIDSVFAKEDRATSLSRMGGEIWRQLEEVDPYVWLNDLYIDGNQLFAVAVSEGQLYRIDVTVDVEDNVSLGDWISVTEDFPPVSRTTVRRENDGAIRWFSISATSVVNRVGVIDSRDLFDSFIAHAEETGEFPVRMFYHQGAEFVTGQTDFLARDGNVYITSGVYDDAPLARAEVRAQQADPDYWGESIGFEPTVPAELVEVRDGITLPVYAQGIHREISTLPRDEAAHMFTSTQVEVRTMKENVIEALKVLFGDDEEGFEDFKESVDGTNRSIEDNKLVTRDVEEGDEEPTPEPEPAAEIVVDDDAIGAMVSALTDSEPFQSLTTSVVEIREAQETGLTELGERLTGFEERLQALEATDEEKQRQWQEDLPPAATTATRVTYRPRDPEPQLEGEEEQLSFAQKAAEAHADIATY